MGVWHFSSGFGVLNLKLRNEKKISYAIWRKIFICHYFYSSGRIASYVTVAIEIMTDKKAS